MISSELYKLCSRSSRLCIRSQFGDRGAKRCAPRERSHIFVGPPSGGKLCAIASPPSRRARAPHRSVIFTTAGRDIPVPSRLEAAAADPPSTGELGVLRKRSEQGWSVQLMISYPWRALCVEGLTGCNSVMFETSRLNKRSAYRFPRLRRGASTNRKFSSASPKISTAAVAPKRRV
jgi:hypothetical protein